MFSHAWAPQHKRLKDTVVVGAVGRSGYRAHLLAEGQLREHHCGQLHPGFPQKQACLALIQICSSTIVPSSRQCVRHVSSHEASSPHAATVHIARRRRAAQLDVQVLVLLLQQISAHCLRTGYRAQGRCCEVWVTHEPHTNLDISLFGHESAVDIA